MDHFDCVVVGAGVVGLAIARALAQSGHGVLVLERERAIGTGSSSRNSEVIHAGIYYEPGSLKARLCVEGRRLLYAYCAERDVPCRRVGKFIVGTAPEHEARLAVILARAQANGVEDMAWMTAAAARAAEPALYCLSAVHSPNTGIVDSHALMRALKDDVERLDGLVVLDTPLAHGTTHDDGWLVTTGGPESVTITSRWLVNAAGLEAQGVASRLEPLLAQHIPALHLARGCYFALSVPSPFSHLIYPVPVEGGLGVHLTLDLGGQARFGPDVEWIDTIDYTVDAERATRFYSEIRPYWPALPDASLRPAFAGIRPKLSGPGEAVRDFVIDGPAVHGVDGLVNLFGIESPGLTAALAIGRYVNDLVTRSDAA